MMTHVLSDLRYAWRSLRKTPVVTAVAVLSIALGIGANTAVFTLVDQVLLRLLPVRQPEQLVVVTAQGTQYGNGWGDGNELSYPRYADLRDHNQVFAGMLCRLGYAFHVTFGGATERVQGELVSGTYFPVLGVGPHLGRTFSPDEDKIPNGHPLAMLSHALLEEPLCERSDHRRQDARRQQSADDDRRRRAGGLRRHQQGQGGADFRADHDGGPPDAADGRHHGSPPALAQRLRAAASRRHAGTGRCRASAVLRLAAADGGRGGGVREGLGGHQGQLPERHGRGHAGRPRPVGSAAAVDHAAARC